ncbi:MAG: M23 family metallopeptidase [Bacillota bacterium]|nr:M23 family metallopeptidase [Bacillota bacterium]
MEKLIRFANYAKLLGLLAIPTLFLDIRWLNIFWLFWLFSLVEVILKPRVTGQSFAMLAGMMILPLRYGKNMPNVDNYQPAAGYHLPFDGAWTVVNGSPYRAASHSWSIPSQRYAYDFIILGANGQSYDGDEHDASSYHCYGQPVLAPADGEVAELLDGQPNSSIPGKGRAECAAKDIRGNYLLLKHNDDEYSLLAHLQPHSLCVKLGERVRRGQMVARCGNSGNTSEPHLHYQLQKGASFSFSPGLPVRFDDIIRQPLAGYRDYDPRGAAETPSADGYIARGMLVQNA